MPDEDVTSPLQLADIHSLTELKWGSAMITALEMILVVDCGHVVSKLTVEISMLSGSIDASVLDVYSSY